MIDNKLQFYQTRAGYDAQKQAGNIPNDALIFVKDTHDIITHGEEGFGGNVAQIDSRISTAISGLDASVSKTAGADGLALSITEIDGKVTAVDGSIAANTYDSYGSANAAQTAAATDATNKVNAAKTEIIGGATSSGNTLKKIEDRVSPLETAVGTGGSVDSRIATAKSEIIGDAATDYNTLGKLEDKVQAEATRAQTAEADRYTKSETYTKEEVHNLITTPNQEYVTVTATSQTTAATDVLPATGEADTVYRVGNWDGTQYNDSVFSEYAWNDSAYVKLSTKSQIGEVYDISANHADTKYADLAAALGTDGANIPQNLRKGGMSVKYVQSSDNKYVQYRLMTNVFSTIVTDWQGVDEEPVAGSGNLVTSGGVIGSFYKNTLGKKLIVSKGTYSNNKFVDSQNRATIRYEIPIKKLDILHFTGTISDLSAYNIWITIKDSQGETVYDYTSWESIGNNMRLWYDGFLIVTFKRSNDANLSDSDIETLNSFEPRLISSEIEHSFSMPDSIERGNINSDGIDVTSFQIRARTAFLPSKLNAGDILLYNGPLSANLCIYNTSKQFVSFSDDISFPYIAVNDGYYRPIFKKSGNADISDEELTAISTQLLVVKTDNIVRNSCVVTTVNGNVDDSYAITTGLSTRLRTPFILMHDGDRIDLTRQGFRKVKVALFNLDFTPYSMVSGGDEYYTPYIHNGDDKYAVVTFSKTQDYQDILPSELNGFIHFYKWDSVYLSDGYSYNISDFESGSIGGTGGGDEISAQNRVRSKEYISVFDVIELELLDTENYLYDVIKYSDTKEHVSSGSFGYTTKGITVSRNESDGTVGYFRIIVKKIDDSTFTEEEIAGISNLVKVTILYSSDNSLPVYYNNEIESVIDRINTNYTANAFSYGIITDTHDDKGSDGGYLSQYLKRQLIALVEMSKKINMLFIAHLGDITSGGQDGKQNTLYLYNEVIDIVKEAKCPVFFIRGNHDDCSYIPSISQRTLESIVLGQEYLVKMTLAGNPNLHVIGDVENNCAFYYDFPDKKIRVIGTDNQISYPIEYQEGTDYLKYTAGQGNWRGISDEQIKWLIDEALVVPEDYRIILLNHDSTNPEITDNSYGDNLHGYDLFNAVKAAFNDKASSMILANSKQSDSRNGYLPEKTNGGETITYPQFVTEADFSNYAGTIILESSGHHHSDVFWKDGNDIVQDNVGSGSPYMQDNHWVPSLGSWESVRTPGTITEALMDVVLVGNSKVNRIRFGAKAVADTKTNEYSI